MFFCRQLHDLLTTELSVDISLCSGELRMRLFSVIQSSVIYHAITKQACRDARGKCSFFPISYIYISRSTLTYRALYYGKIVT